VVYIHLVKRVIALCAAAVLLAGCAQQSSTTDADKAAASEAAKARAGVSVSSETPGADSTAPVSAPPMPKALAANPIYRIGKLPASGCAEPAYRATSLPNVRAYNDFPLTADWQYAWSLVTRNTVDDEHDHGNAANHGYWTFVGLDAGSPAACDIYTAASSLVG
jgi:hypothetical protein